METKKHIKSFKIKKYSNSKWVNEINEQNPCGLINFASGVKDRGWKKQGVGYMIFYTPSRDFIVLELGNN